VHELIWQSTAKNLAAYALDHVVMQHALKLLFHRLCIATY